MRRRNGNGYGHGRRHPHAPGFGREGAPLSSAQEGDLVRLTGIRGGDELRHRLAEMGIRPGTQLRVVRRRRPGPFIVEVGASRFVLGRGMVEKMDIAPEEPAE